MFPLLSRRRLTVAIIVIVTAAAVSGVAALAVRAFSGVTPSSTSASAPVTGPATQPKAPRARRANRTVIGKLVSAEPASITVADAAGHTSTYTIGSGTKVLGPDHQPESLTAIPTGELVVVTASFRGAGHSKGQVSPAPTPTSSGGAVPGGRPAMAVAVEDTGFAAH
jgi:hypothetical protein